MLSLNKLWIVQVIRRLAGVLGLTALIFLSACSFFKIDKSAPNVLFSHSDARAAAASTGGNDWSPTQWHDQIALVDLTQKEAKSVPIAATTPTTLTLFFANDADQLSTNEAFRLSQFWAEIPNRNTIQFMVFGHTDSRHNASYNQGLSERRSQTVAHWLQAKGVKSQAIQLRGFGLSEPHASNATEEGRAMNRRVELRVFADGQQ